MARRTLDAVHCVGLRLCHLPSHPSPIHDEDMTVDITGCIGCQEDDRADQFFGFAPPPHGNPREDLRAPHRVRLKGQCQFGLHVARGDGVDIDATSAPVVTRTIDYFECRKGTAITTQSEYGGACKRPIASVARETLFDTESSSV